MKDSFKGKKILLFSPQFFGYGEEIGSKLREFGAVVDYYDERPGNDFMTKAIIRVNKSFLSKKIDTYYNNIIAHLVPNRYDFVLFLNAEAISEKKLVALRKNQSKAIFIVYMWDSLKNKKYTLDLLPHFDFKHTFDKEDSLNDAHGFRFRPLFFLDAYKKIQSKPDSMKVDLLFVGTVHSDRYQLLMHIKEQFKAWGKTTDYFMFFQSKKLFYAQKTTNKTFRAAKQGDFEFTSLSKQKLIDKISDSSVVLDIQHPDQKGLTMRTIEMIGAQKKIITTNKEIMTYDFYNPNNIYYLDRETLRLDKSFFEIPYVPIQKEIYYKYSIDGWLEDVFSTTSKD